MSSELDLIPAEYRIPEGLRTLANYLRSQNGVKVRSGIEHEKRVDYFKGINNKLYNSGVYCFLNLRFNFYCIKSHRQATY